WFDLVVVLTADNAVLHSRLTTRGYPPAKVEENVQYPPAKVEENVQCEIMRVVVDEAMLVNARVTGHADAEARRSVVTALRVPPAAERH
ncbi:hypothetical protein T484DRAFT_1847039, partial [Baffinella frigidus]